MPMIDTAKLPKLANTKKAKKVASPTIRLRELLSKDRSTCIARCPSLKTARTILEQADLTWAGYCDLKVTSWTALKANPPIKGGTRRLSPDQVAKAQAKLQKQQEAVARLQARIAAAQAQAAQK